MCAQNIGKKVWFDIWLPAEESIEELLTNYCFELGCSGCYEEKGIFHAYFPEQHWNESKLEQLNRYLNELKDLGFLVPSQRFRAEKIVEQDWNEEWKKSFRPIEIAEKVIIKPSWIELDCPEEKICVEIDPQMAFGTGTHATTQLVIRLLLKQKKTFSRILDIGTGTGILSIVAAKIFKTKILAFDIDPIAVSTARENARKNGVASEIYFYCSDRLALSKSPFDLILANITRKVLENFLADINSILSPDGIAIFSGILIEEKETFQKSLEENFLEIVEELPQDEWLGIVARKIA